MFREGRRDSMDVVECSGTSEKMKQIVISDSNSAEDPLVLLEYSCRWTSKNEVIITASPL